VGSTEDTQSEVQPHDSVASLLYSLGHLISVQVERLVTKHQEAVSVMELLVTRLGILEEDLKQLVHVPRAGEWGGKYDPRTP